MKILLAGLLAIATLAGCGSSAAHTAAPAPSTASSGTLDNYTQIACTQIDQGRAKLVAYKASTGNGLLGAPSTAASADTASIGDYLDALHDFQSAVQTATHSADPQTSDRAGAEYVGTLDPDQLQSHLDGWRSFCESKGWVGTP